MKNLKKLIITTLLLTLTSFLMKTVAVSFNVYLTNRIGSVGIGIFQLITSVYLLFKTLSIAGMSLAATRMVIDDIKSTVANMKKLMLSGLILGCISAVLLFSLSNLCAEKWLFNSDAALPLKILAFSLPFISLSAVFGGYFTAIRKMARYSIVQILEQFSRITIAVICLNALLKYGIKYAICGIVIGISLSEVVSFILCFSIYMFDLRKLEHKTPKPRFMKKFLRIALPDSIGSFLRSGLNTIQHIMVPTSLKKSGASVDQSLANYGRIQGMALPILLYPSSVLGVLSGLLIPEIAECNKTKNFEQIDYIVKRVLSITFLFSIATMGIMFGFSDQLSNCIYNSSEASRFLMLIAPLIPIMYIDMATDGMLKGLDQQLTIMKINILDSFLCVILVFWLVPKTALPGYIFTIYAGEVINFILSFRKLKKCCKLNLSMMKNAILPTLNIASAVYITKIFFNFVAIESKTIALISSITFSIIVYSALLYLMKCITKEELHWFKNIFKN